MSQVKKELLAPCGLYCGVCGIYKAHKENKIGLKKVLLPTFNFVAKNVDDISCTGCLSDGVVFIGCQSCQIKKCTSGKEIEGCHQCEEWPCKHIDNFPVTIAKKVMLRNIPLWKVLGTEKFVESEETRYTCPECGNILFRGAKKCIKCETLVKLD
ncbi:MAG: DUF3795 domain-containing protein [Promethearchaeota archaeon]